MNTHTIPARREELLAPVATDLGALKARQQTVWASGDYAVIGTMLQVTGEQLAEACGLRAGEAVLDVAAGNGNASLAAARRGCRVIASDYVPALLERAAARARADGLPLQTRVADAECLPFEDDSFDAVVSTFGVMFTADSVRAARELLRVCRPGGRIGLANWTPDSFVGRLFRLIATVAPPPADVPPPASWGTRERLERLFGSAAARIAIEPRTFRFRFRSPDDLVDVFAAAYGPVHRVLASAAPEQARRLREQMAALVAGLNEADASALVVPSEYLEVVVTRR